jgi:hypothetical protein
VSLCAAGLLATGENRRRWSSTRTHARLLTEAPAGRRETLQLGTCSHCRVAEGAGSLSRRRVGPGHAARLGGTAVTSMQPGTVRPPVGLAIRIRTPPRGGRGQVASHATDHPDVVERGRAGAPSSGCPRTTRARPRRTARRHARQRVGDAPRLTGPGVGSVRPDLRSRAVRARRHRRHQGMIVDALRSFRHLREHDETTDWLGQRSTKPAVPGAGAQQLSEARAANSNCPDTPAIPRPITLTSCRRCPTC